MKAESEHERRLKYRLNNVVKSRKVKTLTFFEYLIDHLAFQNCPLESSRLVKSLHHLFKLREIVEEGADEVEEQRKGLMSLSVRAQFIYLGNFAREQIKSFVERTYLVEN